MSFYTIQEIESLQLADITINEVRKIRAHLHGSFYFTGSSEILTDGRSAKEVIGNELSRFVEFLMNPAPRSDAKGGHQ